MSRQDNGGTGPRPEHLLGGYATGSLSEEEQKILFEAALKNPALFEELMKEQALKERLEQPGERRELIDSLEARPRGWQRFRKWLGSPVAWTAAGAVAATVVVGLFIGRTEHKAGVPAVDIAMRSQERLPEPAVPSPAPERRAAETPQPARKPARKLAPKKERQAPGEAQRFEAPVRNQESADRAALPAAPKVEASPATAAPHAAPVAEAVVVAPQAAPPANTASAGRAEDLARKAPAPPPAPSLDYAILRSSGDGVFRPVASGQDLSGGDRFKVTVTPNVGGPLTVSMRSRRGLVTVLRSGAAQAGATLIVPADGSLTADDIRMVVLEFGDAAGLGSGGEGQPMLGFRMPSSPRAMGTTRERAAAATAQAAPKGVRIEIPIGR